MCEKGDGRTNLSSDDGETRGVVGVMDPGLKNVSKPSSSPSCGLIVGLVGARVLALFGRPLTKCCNCCPTPVGNSDTESKDSVTIDTKRECKVS